MDIGDRVRWQDKDGNKHQGIIAEFIPKNKAIPEWWISGQAHPKGVRFRTHQLVSKRDDRYIVDCGIHVIANVDGTPIRDVVYRLVSTRWSSLERY